MRKLVALLLTVMLVLGTVSVASAAAQINVVVNGNTLAEQCVMVDNRVLAPVRAISEAMGATVSWDNKEKLVTVKKNVFTIVNGQTYEQARTVYMWIGKNTVSINGMFTRELDVPAQIISGKTMIPVRAIGELMEAKVDWDNTAKIASITYATSASDAKAQAMQQEMDLDNAIDNYLNNVGGNDPERGLYIKTDSIDYKNGSVTVEAVNVISKTTLPIVAYFRIIDVETKEVIATFPINVKPLNPGQSQMIVLENIPTKYLISKQFTDDISLTE